MSFWRVMVGDALERLRDLEDQTVQTCVTSPPYFGLRDYGDEGQLGLEATPDEYVARLVEVFREVRRVLRNDGTLWLNLGDSYANNPSSAVNRNGLTGSLNDGKADFPVREGTRGSQQRRELPDDIKPKDLLGIPWMVAFALRADGWYLRSDIIWAKPNPMPESVTDRPTKSHEYVFLLSKSPRYYYDSDAIREQDGGHPSGNGFAGRQDHRISGGLAVGGTEEQWEPGGGRNKRSVWTVATQPFPGAHFAVFPPKLIEPCVMAGSAEDACGVCGAPWVRVVERDTPDLPRGERSWSQGSAVGQPQRDALGPPGNGLDVQPTRTVGFEPSCDHQDKTGSSTVLDPFSGAGTTGLVATRLGRSFIGIELNPEYAEMARERIRDDAPLMNYLIEDEEVSPHA